MEGELSIRRYRRTDRERVEAVMEAALRDANAYFEETPADAAATYREKYLESGGEFLVGEQDGQIVATGAFRPLGEFLAGFLDSVPERAVELKQMHVAPRYQRRGHGQRILEALERRARQGGYTTLPLETTSLQSAAQHFYEGNGYEAVAREPVEAEGRSFDVLAYRKDIEY